MPRQKKYQNDPQGAGERRDHRHLVDCVIFGFDDNELKVLLIKFGLRKIENQWSLLGILSATTKTSTRPTYRILRERTA